MKSQAIANRINSNMFSYGAKTRTFFADQSQLSHANKNAFDQLWHDEGGEGFVMVSDRTGREVPFVLDHTEREADGDVRMWRFVPHQHVVWQDEKLRGVSVIIFNT